MDWLARREYGRVELSRRLVRAGFDTEAVERALEGLVADGLQCDDRFTESFIRHRASQAYGPIRIRAELTARGVEASRVDHHLQRFEGNWFEVAERAWRRRFGDSPTESFKDKARRYQILSRRGFTREQIEHAAEVCPGEDHEKQF